MYLDRKVDWNQTVTCSMDVQYAGFGITGNETPPGSGPWPLAVPGRDFALCASPLHSLVTSIQATICDQQVSSNLAQNREIMSLLADSPHNREDRTQPCALDVYADYNAAYGTLMSPISGFDTASSGSMLGNGCWPITWLSPAGGVLAPGDTYVDVYGNTVQLLGSVLCLQVAAAPLANSSAAVQCFFKFTSVEPLQLSPFIWREVMERETGLSQLQNLNIVMNCQSPQNARLIRSCTANGRFISNVQFFSGTAGTPFTGAGLTGQFLSPPMSAELPYQPVNTVDYQNIVAYVYPGFSGGGSVKRGALGSTGCRVQSQTLSLNTIPDWLIVAVQPTPAYMAAQLQQPPSHIKPMGTWYFPVTNVNVTWSNVTGLLSSQTQEQLFAICKANKLKMTWAQWRGFAQTSSAGREGLAWLTGGPLVLRPGVDLTLPSGQSSGQANGQWTVQFDIGVDTSQIPDSVLLDPAFAMQTTILAVNSGFFTTSSGSSRIITGPMTVPPAAVRTDRDQHMAPAGDRLIGAGGGGGKRGMASRLL